MLSKTTCPDLIGKSCLSEVKIGVAGITLYTFLVFIFIVISVQAQEIEATLGGSTSSQGFSVKDNASNTLIRIAGDGNVGIGTASPTANLHIYQLNANAVLQIEAQGGDQDPVVQFTGNGPLEYWTVGFDDSDGDKFKIGRGATLGTDDKLTIQEDGNVGIGTTSPTAKLHIGGTSGVDGIKFPDGTLQTTAATGGSGLWSASGSYIYYNSGNVGIGTASPSANLHIFQNNGNAVLQIEAQGGDQDPVVQFSGNTGPEYWTVGFDDSDGDKFKIGRGPILGTDDKLTIQEDGNVGIGTTAPTATLDVNSSTGYNQLRLRTSYTPSSSSDTNGNTGDIAWDDSYIYIKTSAGWKRSTLSTF